MLRNLNLSRYKLYTCKCTYFIVSYNFYNYCSSQLQKTFTFQKSLKSYRIMFAVLKISTLWYKFSSMRQCTILKEDSLTSTSVKTKFIAGLIDRLIHQLMKTKLTGFKTRLSTSIENSQLSPSPLAQTPRVVRLTDLLLLVPPSVRSGPSWWPHR